MARFLGDDVQIYRNLQRDCWSIRSPQSGLVIGYAAEIELEGVEFRVGEKSRRRVVREQQKNVHAYARGRIAAIQYMNGRRAGKLVDSQGEEAVRYNPYEERYFFRVSTRERVDFADRVFFTRHGKLLAHEPRPSQSATPS